MGEEDTSERCIVELIRNAVNSCDYVKKHCEEDDGGIFIEAYYCYFNESSMILLLFFVVCVFIAFHMLSSTAENYLSPALSKLANILNLSETMAGVTLVAFGNGAPDVLVAVSTATNGGNEGESGVNFAIGSIFGGALFVTSITVALVIEKAGGTLRPNPTMFSRDAFFYLFANTIILVYGIIGEVKWWMGLLFVLIYAFYLAYVIYLEKTTPVSQMEADEKKEQEQKQGEITLELSNKDEMEKKQYTINDTAGSEVSSQITKPMMDSEYVESEGEVKNRQGTINLQAFVQTDYYKAREENNKNYKKQQTTGSQAVVFKGIQHRFNRQRHEILTKFLHTSDKWQEMEFMDKIVYIWEFPADFIRDITIPPSDEDTWNKWRAILNCITAPQFFLFFNGMIEEDIFDPWDEHYYVPIIFLCLGVIAAVFVWKTSHSNKPPSYFLQVISQISKVYLGMTFLAYGNSAGDYFTNGQLASMGYGIMAFTACFAGQLFNQLIGFGLVLIISSLSQDDNTFEFNVFEPTDDSNFELIQTIISCMVMLAQWFNIFVLIIYAFSKKFVFGSYIASWLRMYYIAVFLSVTVLGIVSDLYR